MRGWEFLYGQVLGKGMCRFCRYLWQTRKWSAPCIHPARAHGWCRSPHPLCEHTALSERPPAPGTSVPDLLSPAAAPLWSRRREKENSPGFAWLGVAIFISKCLRKHRTRWGISKTFLVLFLCLQIAAMDSDPRKDSNPWLPAGQHRVSKSFSHWRTTGFSN